MMYLISKVYVELIPEKVQSSHLFLTWIRIIVPIRPDVAVTIAHSGLHIRLFRHTYMRPSGVSYMMIRIN